MKIRIFKRYLLVGLFIVVFYQQGYAQTVAQPITYARFMHKVDSGNLEYAAEKLNVSIAQAEVIAAKVRNDPQLGLEYFNNEQAKLKMGYGGSVSLSQTITFGKRTAGIELAQSESLLSQSLLADYLRNLRAEAALSFFEALKQDMLYQVKKDAYENMLELAKSDSIRLSKGQIMEIDAIQSKLEAGMMYTELLQSETEMKKSFSELSAFTGTKDLEILFQPKASPHIPYYDFKLSDLFACGRLYRADLVAAMQNVDVANKALKVTRKARNMDVNVSLELSHNAEVKNVIAPAPAYSAVTAGISFPLPFSRLNKGAIMASQQRVQQASLQYDQAVVQVQHEIGEAYYQYQSTAKQVNHYEDGMLKQAKEVLKGKIYSYARGEVSLLEVLNAQRTYDDVQALYYEALFNYVSARIDLEKSAGIWDMEKYISIK